MSSVAAIGLFFAVLILFASIPRIRDAEFSGRAWVFFRVFFPSWRFFENFAWIPRLQVQCGKDRRWRNPLAEVPRRALGLFHQPFGNDRMACQSLVERFAADIAELPDAAHGEWASSVSYRLVEQLARVSILERGWGTIGTEFYFRIHAERPGHPDAEEVLLISGRHEV